MFVRAAMQNVIREAIISSILVSVLILVFLGSWRNMVIVSTSIPLSIFAGIVGLFLTGNTINLMTLGGLALAIGLLVDDATVTIENIHRNQSLGKAADGGDPRRRARGDPAADRRHAGDLHRVLPGRAAVRRGALPVHAAGRHRRVLHAGVLRAVVQRGAGSRACCGSRGEHHGPPRGFFGACSIAASTASATATAGCWRAPCTVACSCWSAPARCWWSPGGLATVIGLDFFPCADAGLIKLHFRAPPGTRIERTEELVLQVEDSIRQIIPAERDSRPSTTRSGARLVQPGVRADRQRRRRWTPRS